MTELTSTAKKIMEVFRYFRIKRDDILSTKLLLSKRHLWRDIEEEELTHAIEELTGLGYIAKIEFPEGWRLLERGAEYLKELAK
jgi:hypothetical protein